MASGVELPQWHSSLLHHRPRHVLRCVGNTNETFGITRNFTILCDIYLTNLSLNCTWAYHLQEQLMNHSVLLLGPLYPYCGGPRSVDSLAAASARGRVLVYGVTQTVTGPLMILSAAVCRWETILIVHPSGVTQWNCVASYKRGSEGAI